jgi:protein-export membrane protein, SecD/SecF family
MSTKKNQGKKKTNTKNVEKVHKVETIKIEEKIEKIVTIEKVETIEEKKPASRKELIKEKAKKRSLIRGIITATVIFIICVASLFPLLKSTKFGLDLQGGFEILYSVNSTDGAKVSNAMINSTYKIILKRIDILGVSEPEISIEGNNIRIQLAGVTDEKEAKNVLSQMANLTFRNSKDELLMTSSVLKGNGVKVAQDDSALGVYLIVLEIADVNTFHAKTEEVRKAGETLVIWLDFEEGVNSFAEEQPNCGSDKNSRCISYASIREELTTSTVTLSGNFTQEEATSLAELINSGSLPTKLTEISSKTVNASFGEDALQKTMLAGIIGIIVIMIYLISLYRFSGVIASIGIIIYTTLVFLIFNLIGGRLTLPGIAAVVIGIGMAVDATVISFARIKEELREKNTLAESFKRGNKNSLTSIIDSNITTLIAAIILFVFGESSVKGFATMLIISIIVTIFVMVFVMRYLLNLFIKSSYFENKYKFFLGVKDLNKRGFLEKFDYIKHRNKFIISTILVCSAGSIYLGMNGFNLGIDFKGGSNISLTSSEKLNLETVEKDIKELGYKVEKIEKLDDNSIYITVSDVFDAKDNEKVEAYFGEKYKNTTTSIGSVSNIVKKQLLENAIKALLYACIGLIIYVSLRFTFSYGISAIIALAHDVLIVSIVFSLMKFEVTTIFIAAILSIIGYSINNTIVAFDRIRENKAKIYKNKIKSKAELKDLVNRSLRETVNRSLITSITTLIPVVSLIILGSYEIANFNYALLIGLIAGTYSSLLIASQIWLLFESKNIGKPEKKKWYEVDDKDDIEELKVKGINC